jgi:voltage-gated potassium channel
MHSTCAHLRERLRVIIFESDTRAGKAFDVVLLWLIGGSVAVVMLESVEGVRANYLPALVALEWSFTVAFTVEYALRIWTSGGARRYIFSFFGIIDLLSVLPTYLTLIPGLEGAHYVIVLRVMRLLRMFRVLKMARHLSEAQTILRALRASAAKVTVFLFGVVSLTMIAGTAMYLIEGPERGFTSIPVSVYWAIVTITTVGFGDITPSTPLGQLLASAMMITGYAVLAVPTGIVGVEIYNEIRSSQRVACPSCGSVGHRRGACFCDHCGSALPPGSDSGS